MLTETQIVDTVALLSARFNLPMPKVVTNGSQREYRKLRNGRYLYDKTICVGPFAWRGLDCVLHEFAHYLKHARENFQPLTSAHGRAFRFALFDVALAYYGNAGAYNWQTEYKGIAAWYARNEASGFNLAYTTVKMAAGPKE